MESDVELAILHAVDVAVTRQARLASVTLRGGGDAEYVRALARASLARRGADADVHVVAGGASVELDCLELATS
jgi:hypothetical protein